MSLIPEILFTTTDECSGYLSGWNHNFLLEEVGNGELTGRFE